MNQKWLLGALLFFCGFLGICFSCVGLTFASATGANLLLLSLLLIFSIVLIIEGFFLIKNNMHGNT